MGISEKELAILEEIQTRTLWLSMRMIDYANHDRLNTAGNFRLFGNVELGTNVQLVEESNWLADKF
jgi:hypothetical protein